MNIKRLRYTLILPVIILLTVSSTVAGQEGNGESGPLIMETVLFSTDRSIYLPGEVVFLNATIFEADTYTLSELSQVLRTELINSYGNAILQEKFEISSGRVSGKIKLPSDIPTGWYQIRLYTNWMRNFPATCFSVGNIRIINPSGMENVRISDSHDSVRVSLLTTGNQNLVTGNDDFYAVRSVDMYGNPLAFKGVLLTSKNDTVLRFQTGKTGWGTINFAPEKDLKYRFMPDSDHRVVVISDIPKTELSGTRMKVDRVPGALVVTLEQPETDDGTKVRLLVHSMYKWYWHSSLQTKNGVAAFTVPFRTLPSSSILQLSLIDNDNKIIAARLIIDGDIVSNGGEITIEPQDASVRNFVARYIVDREGSDGNYNLIVRKNEPVELTSLYIPGVPGWPVNNTIPLDQSERDAWLLANLYDTTIALSFLKGGSEEPLSRILNVSTPVYMKEQMVNFLPETRGLKISGMIIRKSTGEPLSGEILTITTLTDNFLYTSTTHESGRFHFSLPDRAGREDAILSYARKSDVDWQLTLSPDFDQRPSVQVPTRVLLSYAELDYIMNLSMDQQIKVIYEMPDNRPETTSVPNYSRNNQLLGKPDFEIYVDDYIRLPNMREVIFEVVPFVVTRKAGENWTMRVTGTHAFPDQLHSLITLDGIPMVQFDEFLNLPPERIKKIEVINRVYIHGNAMFAGAVNFISANGDLAGLDLPAQSQIISMKMPVQSETLEIDQQQNREPGMPQLSSLLKMQPFVPVGRGEAQFTTSDNQGEYIFMVTGFTKEGMWVNISRKFEQPYSHKKKNDD